MARYGGLGVRLGKGSTLLGIVAKGVGARHIITQSLRLALVIALFPCMVLNHALAYRRVSEANEQSDTVWIYSIDYCNSSML